jgi:hypothetical protein
MKVKIKKPNRVTKQVKKAKKKEVTFGNYGDFLIKK